MADDLPVDEVARRLGAEPGSVYLDVRSTAEFAHGHPAGAFNVPLLEPPPGGFRQLPNPRFLEVVEAVVPRESAVFVGCATGNRSAHAASMLAARGYTRVYNVAGGFNGRRTLFGGVAAPGWRDRGLPVEAGDGGERSWAALRDKRGG